jgi:hypothetical protein
MRPICHAIDETGHRYGRLIVLRYAGIDSGGGCAWLCRCDCGGEITVRGAKLRQGRVVSDGCYRADPRTRRAAWRKRRRKR